MAETHRPSEKSRWPVVAVAVAIVLAAFALRTYGLAAQSLWSDESISLERSSVPLPDLIASMPVEHAPLYFVLIDLWLRVAGSSDFALRFPSAAFGVLAVALLLALGRALFGARVAASSALALAVSSLNVWYGQEARMYAMVTAFSTAAFVALVLAVRRGSARAWMAYVASAVAAVYTHYYGLLVPAIGLVYGLGMVAVGVRSPPAGPRRPPALARQLALAHVAIALAFGPWLPRALGLLGFPGWRPPASWRWVVLELPVRYALGTSVPARPAAWLTVGYLALALVGVGALVVDVRRQRHAEGAWLLASAALVTASALVVVLSWKADLHERYFLLATPLGYLLLGRGIAAPRGRIAGWFGAAALGYVCLTSGWSLALHYTDSAYAKPDYREYTAHIVAAAGANDALVLYGPGRFLTKRYGGDALPEIYNLRSTANRDKSPDQIEQLLDEIAREHDQVWLAVEGRDPGPVKAWFDRHGYLAEGGWRIGLQLYRYAFAPGVEPPLQAVQPTVPGAQVAFAGSVVAGARGSAELVLVDVRMWPLVGRLPDDARVSVRLRSGVLGDIVARDGPLVSLPGGPAAGPASRGSEAGGVPASALGARVALPDAPAASAAQRQVYAILYRAADPSPLAEAVIGQLAPK